MFTNLIESDSHRKEFKRRSSFFAVTVAAYTLFFFAAAIVGVLTYDAQVEAQTTDFIVELIPAVKSVDKPDKPNRPKTTNPPRKTHAPVDPNLTKSMRTEAPVAPVSESLKPPDTIGTTGSTVPPATGPVDIGPKNADPPSAPPNKEGSCVNCTGTTPGGTVEDKKPVEPPVKATPKTITSTMIASQAVSLPRPDYPAIARQARVQGPVNVQILVDEHGKVISATAVKGNGMLFRAAEDAARRARFTPTTLNNQPVKVQGVITYNFVLQ